ncbi:SDR family oxidoreductase, partial [Lysinibacillus sp. D4B1_S16]|uniref:SDR family oxidoreductase n=1 Tax=Lysinibacillus sp. D4B1_S16 TaxID=2941231 RepID=UPI0020C0D612
ALGSAQHGANILINYIGDEHEAEAVRMEAEEFGVKALTFHADVSKSQEVQDMYHYMDKHLGEIEILVNNG